MYHRYGRQGPFAWKHLRERKYVNRPAVLPILVVSTTMIVHVVVSPPAERVIVIIMPEHGKLDEVDVDEQALQIFTEPRIERSPVSNPPMASAGGETPQLSQGDSRLVSDA
jgi:hypothetical protein